MNNVVETQKLETSARACCANCLYSNLEQMQGQLMRMLICHGAPPQTFVVPNPQGLQQVTTFPVVQPPMWCGMHRFKDDQPEKQIIEGAS